MLPGCAVDVEVVVSFESPLSDSLSWRMPLPTALSASGSGFGPRTTRAMTSTITSSMGPTFGIWRSARPVRDRITRLARPATRSGFGVCRVRGPTQPEGAATMAEAPNAVRELAEDATSRKRVPRQAGGGGVAASLAVFIAACGGELKVVLEGGRDGYAHDERQERHRGVRQGRSRHRRVRADARVPRDGLLQGRHSGCSGQGARPRQAVRQRRAGARRRAER